MKKSIFLFFAAILCAMTANAQWALMGTLTDWGSGKAMTVSGTTATCTVDLAGKTEYKLKVKNGGTWYGRNDTNISATTTTSAFSKTGGDVTLNTDIPGTYTFSFNTSTLKLTVTYPTAPAPHDITVRAQVPASWTNTITAWVWTSENGAGEEVTPTKDGDYYVVTKNAGALYAIFKNGAGWNGDKNQTVDLCYTEDVCLQLNQSGDAKATATVIECGAVAKDITVKAVVPGAWEETITAWVWPTGGAGKVVTATKNGNWYEITENCIELNAIFRNGTDWNGNENQTVDITGVTENACYQISALNKEGGKCSVTPVDCEAAIEPEAKPEPTPTYEYYITGSFNGWNEKDPAHGMTLDGEVYKATVTLDAGENLVKVTNGTWTDAKGYSAMGAEYEEVEQGASDDNIKVTLAAGKDVVVVYNATTKKVTFEGLTEKAPAPTFDYYICGSFNSNNPKNAENGMTLDGAVYKATVTLAADDNMLKVTDGSWDNTWGYSNLGAAYEEVSNPNDYNNIKITLAAEKEITVIFDATAGKITFEGLTPYVAPLTYTVTVPAGTEKCYIAGNMNGWAFQEMEAVTGETNKFTITIVGAKETDEYKYACQADWAYAEVIDGGGNRTQWTALDNVTAWNAPAEPVEMASVVLMGVDGDWATGVEMELNPNDANEYMLLCQPITADEPIKIKAVDTQSTVTWCAKLADTSLGTVVNDAEGNENIVLEEGKYDFYYKVAENEVWIGTCTETEPEYNVVEDEITNFVFDTEAWPMVCMGGPSTNYQVEVFLTLTEDADGTLAYEDCSVSIMGTDATFIDGTLSNIDVYAPSADAVLHVLWQEEYYELKLSMSAVSSAAPVDVMAADATVTFNDNEGALKFNGTNVYDDDAVYVELAGFEYNGAGEYTLNGAQISMFENTDAFAFADEVTVAIDEDGYVTVEGVYTSFNGGGIYNVHIWGALPKYTLTLSSDVSDATLTGSDTYYATQEVTVTATQELPGWVFDHWSDGDEKVSTDATYTFRIGKDLELTANYLEIYTRTVASGSYGTICLPNGSVKVEGAKFYEVTFKKDGYIYADEVTTLDAGMPYIFHATSTEIKVYYNETTASAGSKNGVYGTFSDITDGDAGTTGNVLEGKYLLVAGPQVQKCAGNCSLAANRAYFVVSEISDVEQQSAPGRQRIALGCQDENQATGLDNITENGAVAPALQGTYDILGRQLSEPAANGFYIINGKKVLVVK